MKWIEIADTAVKVGLGALIGWASTFSLERLRQKQERARFRREEWHTKLVDPIIKFVDDLLLPMTEAYWTYMAGNRADLGEQLHTLQGAEGLIEARVAALANPELAQDFQALTTQLPAVREALALGRPVVAREEMKKAFDLAGKVFGSLLKGEEDA